MSWEGESYCDNCPDQGNCDGEHCELATNPMGNTHEDPHTALMIKREREEEQARAAENRRRHQLTPEERQKEDERDQKRREAYERRCREHEERQKGIKAGLAYVQKYRSSGADFSFKRAD